MRNTGATHLYGDILGHGKRNNNRPTGIRQTIPRRISIEGTRRTTPTARRMQPHHMTSTGQTGPVQIPLSENSERISPTATTVFGKLGTPGNRANWTRQICMPYLCSTETEKQRDTMGKRLTTTKQNHRKGLHTTPGCQQNPRGCSTRQLSKRSGPHKRLPPSPNRTRIRKVQHHQRR